VADPVPAVIAEFARARKGRFLLAVTVPSEMRAINPLHAVLLASTVPLFLGGLISDIAYGSTYQIQWNNFSAWLLAGAMVFTGLALLWSFIELIRVRPYKGWPLISFVLLLAAFVLGLIDCFIHARDAFGSMPDGLVFSAIVTLIVMAATWAGFSSLRVGAPR
jgi:uncharacterized membrane protein